MFYIDWIEFSKYVGLPGVICLVLMFGIYKLVLRLFIPVSDKMILALEKSINTVSEISDILVDIHKETIKAKDLAAIVTAEIEQAHNKLRDEHRIILSKLNGTGPK